MLSLLLAASLAVAQVPDSAHVVLVATTDVHGRATGWDYTAGRPSAGLARVAPVVDSLRRRYPGQVVVLDAGDLLQGDPFAGYFARVAPVTPHPVIEAMNLVGYDAVTPGNHDFDFGVPAFFRAVRDAAFPYVSANLYAERGDSLLFPRYRVLRRQGVRVGVTGFTTPGVMVWNRSRLRGSVRVEPIDRAAPATLRALRRSSDLAVVLMHSGMEGPATYDTTGIGAEHVAASLADMAVRPHVVVVGHSHREMADSVVGGVHFVQPRQHARGVSVVHVDLRRGEEGWKVTGIRAEAVPTADRAASSLVTQRLAARHETVRRWVEEPIGLTVASMPARDARARPTPLLDFILEVQRRRAGADLAAGPAFDLRAGFGPDTIRRGQVLQLYPYDNTLRAVRITGEQLRAYLEWSARYFRVDPAGRVALNDSVPGYDYDVVRGARYRVDLHRPVGERIRELSVGGRPVEPGDSFTLALNSHRQTGAGGYTMLRGAPVVYDRDENIPDLLVEEIRRLGEVDPAAIAPSEWHLAPDVAATAVRRLFGVPDDTAPVSPRDSVLLRVLATANLHGRLLESAGPLVHAMDSLGAECDCPTLRLDGGDAWRGGRQAVEVLAEMKYDAAVLGDRDFDRPLDSLRRRGLERQVPWVVANIFDSASGRRPDWLAPYRVVKAGGVGVAVLGYLTAATKASRPPERTAGLRFGEGELGLHDALAEARSAGPGLTILLAHAAGACDSVVCDGEVVRLAEQLGGSGVDLIVAGDARKDLETRVAGIAVVGPGAAGSLAVTDLVRTASGGRTFRTRFHRVGGGAPTPGTPLSAVVERLGRHRDSLARVVVAQVKRPLTRTEGQHALGALVAEARRNALRSDLGLVRNAALQGDLPAGPVTYRRLAEVEPGGAELVRLTLSGEQVRQVLEQAVAGSGPPPVHLAGATVRYDPRATPGRRVRSVKLLGGRGLRPAEAYTLATDDATADGADGLSVLSDRPTVRVGLLDLEAVARYLGRLPQPVEAGPAATLVSTRR